MQRTRRRRVNKHRLNSIWHSFANFVAAKLMKLLFGCVARVHVLHVERANCSGGMLLASNHISHFDPFVISSVVQRKIDWMAMAEFFPNHVLGFLLRAVDAFPAARDRADSKTIRTALARLRAGRVVGIFPEGGIRDGARSLLKGAPLRPGAATLAQVAGAPVLPCVIIGTDRLYAAGNWLPFRRVRIWISFGQPISPPVNVEKHSARAQMDRELAAAFQCLYAELRQKFALTSVDLPHSPRERMREAGSARDAVRGQFEPKRRLSAAPVAFQRRTFRSSVLDSVMCASMNLLQSRHRLDESSRQEMERYVIECEKLTAHEYYAAPNGVGLTDLTRQLRFNAETPSIRWPSPIKSKFSANDTARVDLFPSARGWEAPTLLMLHALMSATQIGYRRWAAHFNKLGWNACFVHLPYHYSRVPPGYWNGELAITANLIRNAEALRQGVIELRQLMAALREYGCSDFGVLGTSYGGWIGALLAMVERDFRFLALMAPIVNVEHAIWQSPASRSMRRKLNRAKVDPHLVARHFHLSSPLHNLPLCDPERILFVAGDFDIIARSRDIEAIHEKWRGSELLRVRQGHFGYRMFRETVYHLHARGMLSHSVT